MFVITIDDIRGAFDNVQIAHVIAVHERYLSSPALLRFIEASLTGNNPRRIIGIDQGNPYSPVALNALLDAHHDQVLDNRVEANNVLWWRYADNLVYLTRSISEGRRILETATELLRPIKLDLKGEGGGSTDLGGKPAELLGLRLRSHRGQIEFHIGAGAWRKLEWSLEDCHGTIDPAEAARLTIRGWIGAMAPALENMTEADRHRINRMATRNGFRGIAPELLQTTPEEPMKRWQRLIRRTAARRQHPAT